MIAMNVCLGYFTLVGFWMQFVHLHGHSSYSLLEAIGTVPPLIGCIKDFGMSSVGICDYHGMYGCYDIYKTCKSNAIKPLIGVEMPFVVDGSSTRVRGSYLGYVCLLAKNYHGYQNLLKLVSHAHLTYGSDLPLIDVGDLVALGQDILLFVGGERSFVGQMLMKQDDTKKIEEIMGLLCDALGKDNVLCEIVGSSCVSPHLEHINNRCLKFGQGLGLMCFASSPFHYIKREDKGAFEVAMCIKDGKKIYDEDRRKVLGDFHIKTADEVRAEFVGNAWKENLIDELMNNTILISDMIDLKINLGATLFPHYKTPGEIQDLFEKYKDELVVDG